MGDINLLDRIKKLSNMISSAITVNDKASKTKFGVVKIGDGIDVSSGKISVSSAGMTIDNIYDGSVTQGQTTEYSLSNPYTDYKILVFCTGTTTASNSGVPVIVENIATGTNNNNSTGLSTMGTFRVNAEDATKFSTPQGTGAVSIKIFGIK